MTKREKRFIELLKKHKYFLTDEFSGCFTCRELEEAIEKSEKSGELVGVVWRLYMLEGSICDLCDAREFEIAFNAFKNKCNEILKKLFFWKNERGGR